MRPIACRAIAAVAAVAFCLAAYPRPAAAAAVLAYVEETGGPLDPGRPHPLRDGLLGGLFDAGHIVFDLGEAAVRDVDWRTGQSTSLLALALEGRAALVVLARSEARVTPRDAGRPLVEMTVSYHVLDVSGRLVRNVGSGILSASNRGRENAADATAVARRLGADTAQAVQRALGADTGGTTGTPGGGGAAD